MNPATRLRRSAGPAAASVLLGLTLVAGAGESAKPDTNSESAQPETRLSNTLRWSTASEVDNFGFDVFRSTEQEGPFETINEDPVPGAGTVDTPSNYVYVDDTIVAGQEYFYYIESISMSGERERLTPVFRAPPKGSDDGPEAPPD